MITAASEADLDFCQFAVWYPLLEAVSIRSIILPLDQRFIDYLKEDGIFLPESQHGYLSTDALSDEEDMISSEEKASKRKSFPQLENQLRAALNRFDNEVFVKLNWSCPRDAVWMNNGSNKCCSISEIYLLLKSSDRIVFDLEKMYELVNNPSKTSPESFHLVIRKWANLIPSMEFRLFVYNGRLIGLCQRECTIYFPFLQDTIEQISQKLRCFWEKEILGILPLENCKIPICFCFFINLSC
jgi:hypothetical protein